MIDVDSLPASSQQLRVLAGELRRQPRSFIQALLAAVHVERQSDDDLDRGIWDSAPPARHVRAAAAENLGIGLARRRGVLEEAVSRREVAAALGKSDQAVSAMLDRGALLGLKIGREWRIPTWQMAPELVEGVVPGLRELATTYLDGVVSLSEWVQRPNADLDGATPRVALLHGDVDRVVAAARTE